MAGPCTERHASILLLKLTELTLTTTWKRLFELREQLYEPVKEYLGAGYEAHFASAPFALRIGAACLVNTAERLDAWVERLSELVNKFLDAPAPVEKEDGTLQPQANFSGDRSLTGGSREFTIREWQLGLWNLQSVGTLDPAKGPPSDGSECAMQLKKQYKMYPELETTSFRRSDWQKELKAKLLQLGAAQQAWKNHVHIKDDTGSQLIAKCREDGYPYVTFMDAANKGQPIQFPVYVTVDAAVLQDRWAEPIEFVVTCD
ncbi:hypothetical protein AK812_SmicGene34157 [Symbiodinium microadriaticum]|uniref:Uncharacterized protein n=1 Tax=Symbiodinium microadriaticum TaxID=2951 RepID=A0A1Q9CPS7_SYMMI|nr:hypothetical protein AK812_SmicGene34157 [Symbiodinium microadriaticum]